MASSGGGGIPNERHAGQRVKPGQKYQNREGFKAHRNMKRAVRDVDAENDLRHRACQGVCRRCAQKVQWRFQYQKYRALRPGKHGKCHACERAVHFSYRNLCQTCATTKKLCPGCSKPPAESQLARPDELSDGGDDGKDESTDDDEYEGVIITRH
mmetsp:Transcript_338/g.1119  ORF Transcript_338/g.1119 Transcript_338/m.1119 type:complete len:155 (-) Transcript_338:157-621(-)